MSPVQYTKENMVEHQQQLARKINEYSMLLSDGIVDRDAPKSDTCVEAKLRWLRSQIIGGFAEIQTPFGSRKLTYADHTASGRCLRYIEEYIIKNLLPFYGNTHTSDNYVGDRTMKMLHEATEFVKKCLGGTQHDALLFCGSGTTAAIKRLQEVLGIAVPSILKEKILNTCIGSEERWVVFVGPYEHHSNLLSWRQSLAEVIEIGLDKEGMIDIDDLKERLEFYQGTGRPMLGSFSACSNVTGICSDTRSLARLLHEFGAFACFDFAASGPYVEIDMRSGAIDGYDAITLSPHKFLGGPGSPGILLMNKALYQLKYVPPSTCGGGTINYVNFFDEQIKELDFGVNWLLKCCRDMHCSCYTLSICSVYKFAICNINNRERGLRQREREVCVVCVKSGFVEGKKQTLFSLQTADIWSTSSPADACRCGLQTADLFPQKKQTAPKSDTLYINDIEEREDAGTPQIIQRVKAALAFQVKEYIKCEVIAKREHDYIERALERLVKLSNVWVLGNTKVERQGILSFLVHTTTNSNKRDKPLNGTFVAKLLNDLFGIQARGGCACAAPYGHFLLGIDQVHSLTMKDAIKKGYIGVKVGWTRVSFPYYMSNEEYEYILAAIEFVAVYGQRFLPLYHLNWNTGSWAFKTNTFQESFLKEKDCKLCASFCSTTVSQAINKLPNIQQQMIDCKTTEFDKYTFYLEVAKHIGNILPEFPPHRRLPKDIDPNSVFFHM
ncbi:putative cysteine desulfurase [Helianthus annuus]|nr:putative cysteine desulfurase [Helianthus annuus]